MQLGSRAHFLERVNHHTPTARSSKPPTTTTIPFESSADPAAAAPSLPWREHRRVGQGRGVGVWVWGDGELGGGEWASRVEKRPGGRGVRTHVRTQASVGTGMSVVRA
jgi:hypothetical protein